jgi:lipid II:glycine glycyltransferase (peptidoglycan interpeptide bridge formation enzyme)
MIVMPRRSVTRFFIPLIDVLLLLFVIFLLMPIANLEELEERRQTAVDLSETVDSLERELQRRTADLNRLEEARGAADEIARLRADVEKLRAAVRDSLQRAAFHIIDIDGKTGDIFYYDPARAENPYVKLADQNAVAALIERHQRAAKDKELYYFFLYPRPETGFPTRAQERRYQAWFANVAHSLKETP